MKKFKNKVAIVANEEMQVRLKEKLTELGYNVGMLWVDLVERYPLVMVNTVDHGYAYNTYESYKHDCILVDNEELFLALCAQSPDVSDWNKGETVIIEGGGFDRIGGDFPKGGHSSKTLVQPSVESLTKHFTRKAKRAAKIEAIRNEIKHMQSCDWLNAVDLNITGCEPVKVLREYAKEAASAAHSAKSDVEFAKDFEAIIALKNVKQMPMDQHEASRQRRMIDVTSNSDEGIYYCHDSGPSKAPEWADLLTGKQESAHIAGMVDKQPIPRVNQTELNQIVREIQEWEDVLKTYQECGGYNKALEETIYHRIESAKRRAVEAIERPLIPF